MLCVSSAGTLQQFITAATTHCSTPWADIEAGDDFSDFSINECFGAALAITYLVDSYGFATDRVRACTLSRLLVTCLFGFSSFAPRWKTRL